MTTTLRILALAGSTRSQSHNVKLLQAAADLARSQGAEVTVLDLRQYPLPLMDEDLEAEQGLPENAAQLKLLLESHHGLLLACPEYNSSITPLLKNVIDWTTRKAVADESPLSAYAGKVAGILSASPGGFGGLRGLRHVREILSNIGVHVVPKQYALAAAHAAFDDAGNLIDEKQQAQLQACVSQLVSTTRAVAGSGS